MQHCYSKQKCLIDTHEGLQFCNLADIVCMFNIAIECELVRRTASRTVTSTIDSAAFSLVWLARPSHLIVEVLRAGKGQSSGSNN